MRRMEGIAAMSSKQLAGLIGPTLVALGAREALNIHIFENQIAAVVYFNGLREIVSVLKGIFEAA